MRLGESHENRGGRAIRDPRRIARMHGSVFPEHRGQRRETFGRHAVAGMLVGFDKHQLARSLLDFDRLDLIPEHAPETRRLGAVLAQGRVPVLLLSRYRILVGEILRGLSHQLAAQRAEESIPVHAIHQRRIAHPGAPARPFDVVGNTAHRLAAAGQHDGGVAQADGLSCQKD
jgi:hypothetical protein